MCTSPPQSPSSITQVLERQVRFTLGDSRVHEQVMNATAYSPNDAPGGPAANETDADVENDTTVEHDTPMEDDPGVLEDPDLSNDSTDEDVAAQNAITAGHILDYPNIPPADYTSTPHSEPPQSHFVIAQDPGNVLAERRALHEVLSQVQSEQERILRFHKHMEESGQMPDDLRHEEAVAGLGVREYRGIETDVGSQVVYWGRELDRLRVFMREKGIIREGRWRLRLGREVG
ncbi:hypothetical protein P154DRAFT_625093 [Amniculicola lignicola CBS 123094]|uniref:Uncharacterized protein n=1 Tax=Amniculicola lignicola CBS 123094 TaxID=1392246 RepID=A0A6A5VYY3_9PLEO|nr:hypothetical protein P154DRAFT_625093 [Amniculicola lignicola CBS 123094]